LLGAISERILDIILEYMYAVTPWKIMM